MASSSSPLAGYSAQLSRYPHQLFSQIKFARGVLHERNRDGSLLKLRRRSGDTKERIRTFTTIRSEDTSPFTSLTDTESRTSVASNDLQSCPREDLQRLVTDNRREEVAEVLNSATAFDNVAEIKVSDDSELHMHPFHDIEVGDRWKEIQGSTNWEGMLDPIDPVLRGELIRYGELAQATYDAFDNDSYSRFRGSCKFNRFRLLEQVKLENRGYEVTHYLYSTASKRLTKVYQKPLVEEQDKWSEDSNWIGFVAVSVDPAEIARLGRRDIVIAWRGTVTDFEWTEHFENAFIPKGLDPHGPRKDQDFKTNLKVEDTFLDMYQTKSPNSRYNRTSAQEQVTAAVQELLQKYKDCTSDISITIVGHSMGAALATLCAYDLAESGVNRRSGKETAEEIVPIAVYAYASPRVGNNAFRDRVLELGVKVLRVVNVNDVITYAPGLMFNENFEFLHPCNQSGVTKWLKPIHLLLDLLPITFTHVGMELELNNLHSPFLRKRSVNRLNLHNLEAYLHLLDGFVATGVPFTPSGRRDFALVNKFSSLLRPSYQIPQFWLQEKNKGLVKDADGRWIRKERELEDIPNVDCWDGSNQTLFAELERIQDNPSSPTADPE